MPFPMSPFERSATPTISGDLSPRDARADEPIEVAVERLRADRLDAAWFAMGATGGILPVPDSLGLKGLLQTGERSGIDFLVPSYRAPVVAAWERTRKTGTASVEVRLVSDPEQLVILYFFDMTETHGVFLGAVVPSTRDDYLEELSRKVEETPPRAPRFARIRKDEFAAVIEVDEAFTQILGWTAQEMVGRHMVEIVHVDDQVLGIDNWMDMLSRPGPGRRVKLRHKHRDGSWVWMEVTNHNFLSDPERACVVAEMIDISDEMAAHEELRAREQLLNRLAEAIPLGLLQVDTRCQVVYTNDRLHAILGTERAESLDDQLSSVIDEDRGIVRDAFESALNAGIDTDVEIRLSPFPESEKDLRYCTFNLRVLSDDSGSVTGAIVCVSDVTESARAREELRAQATYDEVTRCYNRASTMAALETITAAAEDGGRWETPAVIFVDLDHFKHVNDVHGHAAGDEFLRVVAERLHRCVRSEDVVGRIGGDEFLVICPRISTADQAMSTAARLANSLRYDISLKQVSVPSRASIGVTWSAASDVSAETLVARADVAMYESKHSGNGEPVLYDESLPGAADAGGWSWPSPPDARP